MVTAAGNHRYIQTPATRCSTTGNGVDANIDPNLSSGTPSRQRTESPIQIEHTEHTHQSLVETSPLQQNEDNTEHEELQSDSEDDEQPRKKKRKIRKANKNAARSRQSAVREPKGPSDTASLPDIDLHILPEDDDDHPYKVPVSETLAAENCDTHVIDGSLYVKLVKPAGSWAMAVPYHDIHTNPSDITTAAGAQAGWGPTRGVDRPTVLYEYLPQGQYAYGQNDRTKKVYKVFFPFVHTDGRVFVNDNFQVMKFSAHLPMLVSTDIEGWRMVAIMRLDPQLRLSDFVDRMPLNRPDTTKRATKRPTTGTLQTRCVRSRQAIRAILRPRLKKTSYIDRQVAKDMALAGITGNSTEQLQDLTRAQIQCQNIVLYAGKTERAGKRANKDIAIFKTLDDGLHFLRAHGHADDSLEVQTVATRLASYAEKLGKTLANDILSLLPYEEEADNDDDDAGDHDDDPENEAKGSEFEEGEDDDDDD